MISLKNYVSSWATYRKNHQVLCHKRQSLLRYTITNLIFAYAEYVINHLHKVVSAKHWAEFLDMLFFSELSEMSSHQFQNLVQETEYFRLANEQRSELINDEWFMNK